MLSTENHSFKKNSKQLHRLLLQTKCDSNEDCPICLESLHNKSVYWTPCGHTYHKSCFLEHVNGTHDSCYSCPMCREPMINNLKLVIHSRTCHCKKCYTDALQKRDDNMANGELLEKIDNWRMPLNNNIKYATRYELLEKYIIQRHEDLYQGTNIIDPEENNNNDNDNDNDDIEVNLNNSNLENSVVAPIETDDNDVFPELGEIEIELSLIHI